jgi:hypothetical protein
MGVMEEKPSDAEILSAIERSGYLLEQEVANRLEQLEFHVRTNYPFEDCDEGKSREIDVHAFRRIHKDAAGRTVDIVLLCECKNNENPFVLISRRKSAIDQAYTPMEYVFPRIEFEKALQGSPSTTAVVSTFRELGLDKVHYYHSRQDKCVQFAKIVRDGKEWKAQHGGLFDALFLPLAKAVASERERCRGYGQSITLLFPVIVLGGGMYVVDMAGSRRRLAVAQHATFTRRLDASTLKGHFTVDFVVADHLVEFVKGKVLPFAESAAEIATQIPEIAYRR